MTFAQLYAYLAAEEEVARVDTGRLAEAQAALLAAGARQRELDRKAEREKRRG